MKISLCFHKKIAFLFILGLLFFPSLTSAQQPSKNPQQKSSSSQKRKFILHDFNFGIEASLESQIRSVAALEQINVIFEDTIAKLVETKKTTFMAKNISAPEALELILSSNRLSYATVGKKTIIVFTDALANRQRFNEMMLRVFYLKSANVDDVSKAIQQALGAKQLVPLKQLNAILVRDIEENFKVIEDLLTRLDKSKPEFVMDVNLYEVSDQVAAQLGNQLGVLSSNDFSLLQNKASSKLIGSTKLHAFENESSSLNIGSRVPLSIKTKKTPSATTNSQPKQANKVSEKNNEDAANQLTALEEEGGLEITQYTNIGLNIELSPSLSEDYVNLKLNLEMSGATNTLIKNPDFNQYKIKELVSIKKDETRIVASVFPLDGNFFASPTQTSGGAKIIITITPHVLRSPELTPLDKTSFGPNGTPVEFDARTSIEEMLIRAEQNAESK